MGVERLFREKLIMIRDRLEDHVPINRKMMIKMEAIDTVRIARPKVERTYKWSGRS